MVDHNRTRKGFSIEQTATIRRRKLRHLCGDDFCFSAFTFKGFDVVDLPIVNCSSCHGKILIKWNLNVQLFGRHQSDPMMFSFFVTLPSKHWELFVMKNQLKTANSATELSSMWSSLFGITFHIRFWTSSVRYSDEYGDEKWIHHRINKKFVETKWWFALSQGSTDNSIQHRNRNDRRKLLLPVESKFKWILSLSVVSNDNGDGDRTIRN